VDADEAKNVIVDLPQSLDLDVELVEHIRLIHKFGDEPVAP
jgi:hypothetical protein